MGSFFNSIIRESRGEMPTATKTFDTVTDPVSENNLPAVEQHVVPEIDRPSVQRYPETNAHFPVSTNEAQTVTWHNNKHDVFPLVQDSMVQDLSQEPHVITRQTSPGPAVTSLGDDDVDNKPDERSDKRDGDHHDDLTTVLQPNQPNITDARVQSQTDVDQSSEQVYVQPNTERQEDATGFVQREVLSAQHEDSAIVGERSVPFVRRDVSIPEADQTGSFAIQENSELDSQSQAIQPGETHVDLNTIAREKTSEEAQSFVVRHEMHAENNSVRSVAEHSKTHHPQVKIGLVNVVVEAPKQKQSVSSSVQHDDQASRHYLRSL